MSECPAILSVCGTGELGSKLCSFVKDRYDEAVEARGKFHVAVSGGSLPKFLKGLSKRKDIDWTRWWIYFCDERYVSEDDADSNYHALKELLLCDIPEAQMSVLRKQILKINSEIPVEEAANEYEEELKNRLPSLQLDLALCGMGPDGHTCSLFPGHPLLKEETLLIAPISDSPKSPSKRITMTYPLLRKCHNVAFVVTGESKKEVVVSSLSHNPTTPAGLVRPNPGKLFWFLDNAAASEMGCPAMVSTFDSTVELGKRLNAFVKDRYDEAVEARGKFHVAVSGGSLPKFLKGLSKRKDIDWTRWWIYFCDERYVSEDDADSNYLALKQHLLCEIPEAQMSVLRKQILKINSDIPVEEAAKEYEEELKNRLPSLQLDLALCGMGPDGHTCSLFPGHPLLKEETLLIAPISDSPKSPSKRITMTYPLLRKCHNVAFVVTGESKRKAVVSSLSEPPTTPAGLVRPLPGKLFWFLDSSAAADLETREI